MRKSEGKRGAKKSRH